MTDKGKAQYPEAFDGYVLRVTDELIKEHASSPEEKALSRVQLYRNGLLEEMSIRQRLAYSLKNAQAFDLTVLGIVVVCLLGILLLILTGR